MNCYSLKDTTPYKKLKEKFLVFELSSLQEFEQAFYDNIDKGELFIEDTKAYILTPNKKCFVVFYTDKSKITYLLKECQNGGVIDDNNRRNIKE